MVFFMSFVMHNCPLKHEAIEGAFKQSIFLVLLNEFSCGKRYSLLLKYRAKTSERKKNLNRV